MGVGSELGGVVGVLVVGGVRRRNALKQKERGMSEVVVVVGFGTILVNFLLVLLNVKLFTEFAKQRMQEVRKP